MFVAAFTKREWQICSLLTSATLIACPLTVYRNTRSDFSYANTGKIILGVSGTILAGRAGLKLVGQYCSVFYGGRPWGVCHSKVVSALFQELPKISHETGVFIDLGSGHGQILRKSLRNKFQRAIGYELNPFLVAFCRMFYFWDYRIKFIYEDMFKADISQGDVIFAFVGFENMAKLSHKFKEEMKSTAILCTIDEPIPKSIPILEHIVELESGHEQCLYLYNKSGLLNENWDKQRFSQRKYKQWKELDW